MNRILTTLAAFAIVTVPATASAVTLTGESAEQDYTNVNTADTVTLPAFATWAVGGTPQTRTGNSDGLYRTPFDESTGPDVVNSTFGNAAAESYEYFAVGPDNPDNPSRLEFSVDQSSLSFLWGSPDDFNGLTFFLNGGLAGGPFNQGVLSNYTVTAPPSSNVYVTFSGVFDAVEFESSPNNAFEFSNISSTPVSAPASLALLGGGLLALSMVRRRHV